VNAAKTTQATLTTVAIATLFRAMIVASTMLASSASATSRVQKMILNAALRAFPECFMCAELTGRAAGLGSVQ
jgi:hypothetical protein